VTGGDRELLSGWGRAAQSAAELVRPKTAEDVVRLVQGGDGTTSGPSALVARGLGRSYGDAAQCAGGTVIDCTGLDRILEIAPETRRARVEAGVSFDALLRTLVPRGFFLPVSPGTRYVTVGGAVASDVHGKNHHVDGSMSAHVEELTLVAPSGTICCGPSQAPAEYFATCGGMGLTGVITEATLRLLPIETSLVKVETTRASDLDACFAALASGQKARRYSVAWIDALARGGRLGRGVVTAGDHALLGDLNQKARRDPLRYDPQARLDVPLEPPSSLLTSASIAAFNELWFRKAPRGPRESLEQIAGFFHPLDGVGHWNRLYGPHGFTQYQFVVPFGREDVVRTTLERFHAARVAPFLAVLKGFGPAGPGPLSFPDEGWTLALDVPLGRAGLGGLLDGLDELVAAAGGRVYLSKDGRLRPELLATMYPRLDEWAEVQSRLDPGGTLVSDLARRLGLGGRVKG
jgi:decaprenylphospho-beta-D-ribofuranose 2-oxidase